MVIQNEHYISAVLAELIVILKLVFNSQFIEFWHLLIFNFPARNDILRLDEFLATFILDRYFFYDEIICFEHLSIFIITIRLCFSFHTFKLSVKIIKGLSPTSIRRCLLTSSRLTQGRDSFASFKIFSFPRLRLKLLYRFVYYNVPRILLKLI